LARPAVLAQCGMRNGYRPLPFGVTSGAVVKGQTAGTALGIGRATDAQQSRMGRAVMDCSAWQPTGFDSPPSLLACHGGGPFSKGGVLCCPASKPCFSC
jgi:hypothetical protein